MTGPLDGVKVVELAVVIAGPAAAAMLGDWGADVVKIEPGEGDPQRGNTNAALFELDNRGKRSVCLNLKTPEGCALALRLIVSADVFVTNLRPGALRRLGLDFATLHELAPRLVYASITGYGPESDKPGYDVGAFWSRAGIALALTPPGETPPVARPGMGDHTTGLAAVAGISAALLERERTGLGQLVSTSLLRAGTYVLSSDLASEASAVKPIPGLRRMMYNPLLAVYRSGDGKWFWLLGLQATRHWPNITRAIGRPELASDERFVSHEGLMANRREVLAILDAEFLREPMDHWQQVFAECDVWWDPLQSFAEILHDPLVREAGALRSVEGQTHPTIAGPVDFSRHPSDSVDRAPEAGEHTEQVLLELDLTWEDIAALRERGALP